MESIPWYKSNVLRALLVAAIAQVLVFSGAAEDMAPAESARMVDAALQLVELVAIAWAAYARTRMPTPPIGKAPEVTQ